MGLAIASIDTISVEIGMADPLVTSRHAYRHMPFLVTRVSLSDGTLGYGEARENMQITGETCESMIAIINGALAPELIGCDAADFEGVHETMEAVCSYNSSAKSSIDIALYDAIGKSLGRPVSSLLGGRRRGPIASSKAISVGETAAMVEQSRSVVAEGFRTLKIKTGVDAAKEIAAVAAIREAIGPDIYLKLDANQGWSLPQALSFLEAVEKYDIQMVEQPLPVWDLRGSAELRRRTSIPVMLDEGVKSPHDAFIAIDSGACDYINIKLLKAGGLYPASKIVAVAQAAGVACQVGTLDTTIGSAAAVHLVHAFPAIRFAEINGPGRLEFDLASGFILRDGCSSVAEGAGLGVVINEDRVRFTDDARGRTAKFAGTVQQEVSA